MRNFLIMQDDKGRTKYDFKITWILYKIMSSPWASSFPGFIALLLKIAKYKLHFIMDKNNGHI